MSDIQAGDVINQAPQEPPMVCWSVNHFVANGSDKCACGRWLLREVEGYTEAVLAPESEPAA